VFFAAVGASADIRLVLATAPILFGWSFVALSGHLLLLLGLGRLAGFSRKELLLASNANIGGAVQTLLLLLLHLQYVVVCCTVVSTWCSMAVLCIRSSDY
jgi:uncharacterized membrane protein